MALAQRIIASRAGYSVESPPPRVDSGGGGFVKAEADDPDMTALGPDVGVSVGSLPDADRAGIVRLVGSPRLVKWGYSGAGGLNLGESATLVKAFVDLVEEAQ